MGWITCEICGHTWPEDMVYIHVCKHAQRPHPVDVACSAMACSCGREHTFAPLEPYTVIPTAHGQDIAPAVEWKPTPICDWNENEDGQWRTSCNHMFEFADGGPNDNGFRNCPFCGGRLFFAVFEPPKGGTR